MAKNSKKTSEDIQAAGKLTVDAITGITDIVESIHSRILNFGGILGSTEKNRTTGITGMVYRNIRAITKLAGSGIDTLLDQLNIISKEKESSPGREAIVSALNGVLGDYLVAKNNSLAIPMQFRLNGTVLNEQELCEEVEKSGGRIAIMVHGSCMNDLQWLREDHNHGAALAYDLGIFPLYLHYNTGLHISENGKKLSELLETITCSLPPLKELFIVAHSMGGLVSRSACHYGKLSNHKWVNYLKKIVFLGTPHHGSPLEKGGNWIDIMLDANKYSAPLSRLGKIRSAGITDLRYGNITDNDWEGRDRFKSGGDHRISVPLHANVECYTIAATKSKEPNNTADNIIGDGLVPLNSALGIHKNAKLNLNFPESHQLIVRDIKHLDLLNHPDVYKKIKEWLEN